MQLPILQTHDRTNGQAEPTGVPAPVLAELLDAIHQQIVGGLVYTHDRANRNTARLLHTTATTFALLDLLVEKGLIDRNELDARRREQLQRLAELFKKEQMTVYHQRPEQDKYAMPPGEPVDCENRIHLCKAACCKLELALSRQDVDEGVIGWDFARPYLIRRAADGYCAHLDSGACRCTVYAHRPAPCRAYDCREDDRIWSDFERKIVSPKLELLLSGKLDDPPEPTLGGSVDIPSRP